MLETHYTVHTMPYRPPSYRMRERTAYVVAGIPFESEATAVLARQVLIISSALSILAFAAAVLNVVTGWYWGWWLFLVLLTPLCGYCGTMSRSRGLVATFATASLLLSVLYAVAIIATTAALGDWVTCACNEACRVDASISAGDAAKICASPGLYRALYWVSVALGAIMTVLLCAGATFGFRLAGSSHFEPDEYVVALPAGAAGTVAYIVPTQPPYPPPAAVIVSPTGAGGAQYYRAYATPTAAAGGGGAGYTYAAPPTAAAAGGPGTGARAAQPPMKTS